MSKKGVSKEECSDTCQKTGKKFLGTHKEEKICKRCDCYEICPVLNLSRKVRVVEGRIDVFCPETGDPVHSSQCVDCLLKDTCRVLNL